VLRACVVDWGVTVGNGKALLFIAAVCWLALGVYLVGALLRRFELTRKCGQVITKIAFVLYVFGAGAGLLIVLSTINSSDLANVAMIYAIFAGFPVLVCSIQFFELARKRKRDQ
jgi:hypothetical protein